MVLFPGERALTLMWFPTATTRLRNGVQGRYKMEKERKCNITERILIENAKPSDATFLPNSEVNDWTMVLIKHATKNRASICKHGNIFKMMEMIPMWWLALQMAVVNVSSHEKEETRHYGVETRAYPVRPAHMFSHLFPKNSLFWPPEELIRSFSSCARKAQPNIDG